jgi:hypothetical protein
MNDDTSTTLAVNYPVYDLNPCTIFGSHEGMVDSKYNLIATVNHKPSKKNDGHYMAVHTYKVNNLVLVLKKSYEMDNIAKILLPTYNKGPYRILEVFNNGVTVKIL